jgi:hypothetical protein
MRKLIILSAALVIVLLGALVFSEALRRNRSQNLVWHEVGVVRQSSAMNCWSATYAMLVSWKFRRPVGEREAVSTLGEPWTSYQGLGTGLPGGQERDFVRASGLVAEGPADYDLEAFVGMLKEFGPLWITTGDGIRSHARLMVGVSGKSVKDYEGAQFIFIDPLDANVHPVPALEFLADFEKEVSVIVSSGNPVDLRFQVIHWPQKKSK